MDPEVSAENHDNIPKISDLELQEAERKKNEIEKLLQEKILNGKLAYGMYDERERVVIPYLQERELNENVSNSLEVHLFETTASVYKKCNLAKRSNFPKIRNTIISSSPQAHHKRFNSGSCFLPPLLLTPVNYTSKDTPKTLPKEIFYARFMSRSKHCKHRGSPPLNSFNMIPRPKRFHFENKFMDSTTISISLKQNNKRIASNMKKWMLGRRNSEYTPGLDNSAYTPKKWHPIKLDKSILETNPSTQYARSHQRVGSNPTSIVSFSSGIIFRKKRLSIDQTSNMPSSYEGSTDFIQYD